MSMPDDEHGGDRVFERGLRALREDEGTYQQVRALEQRLLATLGPEALDATVTECRARTSAGRGCRWR